MANKYKSSADMVPVDRAVGLVLAHDMTEIRPGQFKGAAFKKGHVVREEDLDHLKRMGKEHIFVLHIDEDELHEDEAASRLATALAGQGVFFDDLPSEGKIALKSAHEGLLKIDVEALTEFNMVPEVACASRHNNTLVGKGEIIAETRAIPLIIGEGAIHSAEEIAKRAGGIFSVKKLARPEIGLIITGNEVYSGRIDDRFAPLISKKFHALGCTVRETVFLPDHKDSIIQEIKRLLEKKLGLILVAGGMSVDPDDVSRIAISEAGAEGIIYGTPVLPGAMFLYGHFGDTPVLGIPACALFYNTTVLDLLIPRILAGETITRKNLAAMAHGGLCLHCEECRYPVCPFGK